MKIFKAIFKSALLFASLGVMLFIGSVSVNAYPNSMQLAYSGTVYPLDRDLSSYMGHCPTSDYTTCYLGAYTNNQPIYDPGLSTNEGGGGHAGVDISGSCDQTVIRSIGAGTVSSVMRNWRDTHPEANACGSNSDGTFGNYVVVEYDNVPDRSGYSGTVM
jgi:murein DD-endopeptidase MepM/ murein hydrolase activator NlpD